MESPPEKGIPDASWLVPPTGRPDRQVLVTVGDDFGRAGVYGRSAAPYAIDSIHRCGLIETTTSSLPPGKLRPIRRIEAINDRSPFRRPGVIVGNRFECHGGVLRASPSTPLRQRWSAPEGPARIQTFPRLHGPLGNAVGWNDVSFRRYGETHFSSGEANAFVSWSEVL